MTDVTAVADLERIRKLFIALETKETMANLLNMADRADGVQIFIGSDSDLFGVSGCSMIVGPYKNESKKVVGAIRGDRTDPDQLRPNHSDGGLHGEGRWADDRLAKAIFSC